MGLGVVLRLEETACTLRGNWCMSSRKKGRRTAGTPDGDCGQPERELPARPLRGFLAPALGSAVFPRAKFARGPTVPQNGSLHCGRAPESLVRSTQKGGHLPLPRGWFAGAKCSRKPTVEREGSKREQIKKKKRTKKGRKENWSLSNLFQLGLLAVLE